MKICNTKKTNNDEQFYLLFSPEKQNIRKYEN